MCQIIRPSLRDILRFARPPFVPRLGAPQQLILTAQTPAGGGGGITFDATGGFARDLGGAFSDVTVPHTCSGSDRALFVSVQNASNGALTITSVTYNGDAMTQLWVLDTSSGVEAKNAGYILINPDTGANNIVITISGNGGGTLGGASTSWNGVNQTGTVGNSWRIPVNGAGGTDPSSIVVANAQAGDVVVDGICMFNVAGVTVPNHTARVTQDPLTVGSNYAGGTQSVDAAGSETMEWTNTSSLWSGGAVALIPA